MTRKPPQPRRASWNTCEACELDSAGTWILGGLRKQQVWSLSVPKGSRTARDFGGRRTARLCRHHIEQTIELDDAFGRLHAGRGLLPPAWWEEAARGVHVAYLERLIAERECPRDIEAAVRGREGDLPRGQVCEWIETARRAKRREQSAGPEGGKPRETAAVQRESARAKKKTSKALIGEIEASLDHVCAAAAELLARMVSETRKVDGRVTGDIQSRAVRSGYDLLMAAAALLCTPDPNGRGFRLLLAADAQENRDTRSIQELTIALARGIQEDMLSFGLERREPQQASKAGREGGRERVPADPQAR